MTNTVADKRTRIPRGVALFFMKALVVFIVWKTAYLLFLQPRRVLDEPLTHAVGVATTGILNLFSSHYTVKKAFQSLDVDGGVVSGYVMDIYHGDTVALRIADACNGLELMVLYIGFLLCFPAPRQLRLKYIGGGLLLIVALNVIRCVILVWMALHYPQYLDFSHHFVFTTLIYGIIFWLWYSFTKKIRVYASPN